MKEFIKKSRKHIERFISAISVESLVAGFNDYLSTWHRVVTRRERLVVLANYDEAPVNINSSISVYLYGVALSFVIYLPLIIMHNLQLPKLYFLLQFVYVQVVSVLLWHLSIKTVRGQGSIKETAGVFCTWIGIVTPVLMLLFYPMLIYSPVVDFINQDAHSTPAFPQWVLIWSLAVFFTMMVLFLILPLRWVASVHKVKPWWIVVGLLLVFFPLMIVHNLYVAPVVSTAIVVFSDLLNHLT